MYIDEKYNKTNIAFYRFSKWQQKKYMKSFTFFYYQINLSLCESSTEFFFILF